VEVNFMVKRLFGNLNISTEITDEDGLCKIIFPSDLPNDNEGKINLIVMVTENDQYGDLEHSLKLGWGASIVKSTDLNVRELWSAHAPLWMIFTLIILLSAVWVHFIIVFYKMYLISRESKELLFD
jgi:hypothetical protein